MDLSKFRDTVKERTSSDIFVYRNLRDFEKVLFLEHQVKELIDLLKRKNKFIQEIQEQMDRIIDEHTESRQVKALKAQVTQNLAIIKKYKTLYEQEVNRNINLKEQLAKTTKTK